MSKISFVMPTKNRADIISESIESIIQQQEKEWELIIIDDHSDKEDQTKKVIEGFNDKRIKYFKMPESYSGGIPQARNFGNMMASSPIIAVADSDDLSKPDRASLTIKAFEEDNCDVFYGDFEIFNKESGSLKEGKSYVRPFDINLLMEKNFIPHSSLAYKRSIALQYPYNSFFKMAEDYDLITRLAVDNKNFYFCNKIIFRYIIHSENTTKAKRLLNYEELIWSIRGWKDRKSSMIAEEIISE